jgi:beta-phosphoglucomutase-like phosphatase (HAD superfamily)
MESARPTLEALGIGPDVPVITRDQVRHAKPDPDLFLAAAERLHVAIGDSVVVGDSVWGLLAARRARALGVGLLSGGYGQEELERAGAYRVYQDPADLMRHLDEIGVRAWIIRLMDGFGDNKGSRKADSDRPAAEADLPRLPAPAPSLSS